MISWNDQLERQPLVKSLTQPILKTVPVGRILLRTVKHKSVKMLPYEPMLGTKIRISQTRVRQLVPQRSEFQQKLMAL